ncbi:hypothetical protein [Streptomyces griseorubiginosus]|uniref:hypothetical protein n=1 Tax=Streptomyces griseorubiginosus TaxID=67304 RepID=UPI002E80D0F7|nr:hypothetical protein [Streptomyces griseorubiginosus]WUB44861.1 hypothetical protein OHN19_16545 [Streptomyces griseorubiginosus]WUB53378.1 hypothetical protein OG942_16540 [Streptomyces griseorubiginosus]
MLRHEFQPGRLIAGVFLTLAGITYVGDAGDAWDTPWFAVIPMVVGGLFLAGAVGSLTRSIRGRRGRRRTSTPPEAEETAQPSSPH